MSDRDELQAADERAARLSCERAEAETSLVQPRRASLPLLDRVTAAAPCEEAWELMEGNDFVRFCRRCQQNVFHLSERTAEQVETLLRTSSDAACMTFFRRPDGTLVTRDCTASMSARPRRSRLLAVAATLGTMAAGLGLVAAFQLGPAKAAPDEPAPVTAVQSEPVRGEAPVPQEHIAARTEPESQDPGDEGDIEQAPDGEPGKEPGKPIQTKRKKKPDKKSGKQPGNKPEQASSQKPFAIPPECLKNPLKC